MQLLPPPSTMRLKSGVGAGYTSIPENEVVNAVGEDESDGASTPVHTNNSGTDGSCLNGGGDRWDHSGLEDVSPPPAANRKRNIVLSFVAAVLLVITCVGIRGIILFDSRHGEGDATSSKRKKRDHYKPRANSERRLFDEIGRYVVEDYDTKPTFSDFLPGVAGLYGKPVWSFYVNRGQGIAAFGSKSKDYPMLEFNSANKAYQNTALLGFRTFLRGKRGDRSFLREPFSPTTSRFEELPDEFGLLPKRYMYVGGNEVAIQEIDTTSMLETNVSYFVLPEEYFGSFVRRTTITNIDSARPITLSVLDGLARMEPVGGPINDYLKDMGRTLEGWFGVYHADQQNRTLPYYRMSTEPSDGAAVVVETEGHYCVSFIENRKAELLPIVYDTSRVFGEDTTLLRPVGLFNNTVRDILSGPQYGFAKTSSAFAAVDEITLPPGKSVTVSSFYGHAKHITDVPVIARKVMQAGYVQYKFSRAREIVNQLTTGVETKTSNHLFNGHVKQMFMDNGLRGGMPMLLGDVDDKSSLSNADEDKRLKVFHVFSRVHGDLERDYNDFIIDPTYFSQGPGNYRDVVQNRRNDVVFNPRIGSSDVKIFLAYIQADGYNPFIVEGIVFTIDDISLCSSLATTAVGAAVGHRAQRDALAGILCDGPFRPGQLFLLMEEQHIELIIDRQKFIDEVIAVADYSPMAVYGDGFWADHWTYYLDLINSYLSIYPEGEESLMYDQRLSYFFSPATVQPRSKKYVLSYTFDGKGRHVRQLNATLEDKKKMSLQKDYVLASTGWYGIQANWQHDGSGTPFKSSPLAKLFLLASLKFATRDAYGMGVEYEGGKPGWNDAMNGLVGMVGSGMPETYELQLLLKYILSTVTRFQRPIEVPVELGILVDSVESALDVLDRSGYKDKERLKSKVPVELFAYWDTVAAARENYRANVTLNFSGGTRTYSTDALISMLQRWLDQVDLGIARACRIGSHGDGNNGTSHVSPTYFSYNVTKWTRTGERNWKGLPLVVPRAMSVGTFALFLEGPMRMMKTVDEKKALQIYEHVKQSGLRDKELNMYTISASLVGQSIDMGRMMAFSPGWLENQSVWTHMSYKYYLELLRNRLYGQFFDEMLSGGMLPFMNADRYGRSLMECSSFLASSAFADESQWGRGFLARLSGATAEFLSMWVLMFIGPKPFFIDENTKELCMQLHPILPLWLFESGDKKATHDEELAVKFKLFASISVTYHNTERKDLFDILPTSYLITNRDGSAITVKGPVLRGDVARRVRGQILVDAIDVFF